MSNNKNKIITTFAVIAVVLSALACYMIYKYLTPQRSTIYVFNNDYKAGEQVVADMLSPLQMDSTVILAGNPSSAGTQFITPSSFSDVVRRGDSLRIDVSEGMPLTTAMLSVSGGSSLEMNMASDAVAISLPLTQFSGVTNDLKEGSKVNVYATINNVTSLIQQKKKILAVFKDEGNIVGVSIEQTADESMQLVNAVTTGSVYLGLVDTNGYEEKTDNLYYVYTAPGEKFLTLEEEADYNAMVDHFAQIEDQPASTATEIVDDELDDSSETDGSEKDSVFVP